MTMESDPLAQPQVIVVGAGLAGLTASIEAYRSGAQVILLEKEKSQGGNSAKATSGMNAVGTATQEAQQIADTTEIFLQDTVQSGGGKSDLLLAHALTSNSKEAHRFMESFGIQLNTLSQCGGHSKPRTHREGPRSDGKPAPVGWDMSKLHFYSVMMILMLFLLQFRYGKQTEHATQIN
jgi:succinate dehydrogenase/fumarate reductase flavoprotein subunit